MKNVFRSALLLLFIAFLITLLISTSGPARDKSSFNDLCIECHTQITPQIVTDWELSRHSEVRTDCVFCHGKDHVAEDDAVNARLANIDTCAACHNTQADQFRKGKHALAWDAMNAMPTIHWQPMAMTEGMKGCGGCHKLGIKSDDETKRLKNDGTGYGLASCNACHTRHLFTAEEARQPQACRTCHMGMDHPQWEMYESSKHGVRNSLKQLGKLPEEAAAPTCQTCHMSGGNHEVRTAWGFMAIRLPMPEEEQWAEDRAMIFKGLGVLDPEGNPTERLDAVKSIDLLRQTEEAWQAERNKMLAVCISCHSGNFAGQELEKGDEMIREVDRVMADAIKIVADLYEEGILEKPESYSYPFPDLLTFHDAPTSIEQELFLMFLKYRMRAFQGTFHANPDYALWYGWSPMRQSLTKIKSMAADMRK